MTTEKTNCCVYCLKFTNNNEYLCMSAYYVNGTINFFCNSVICRKCSITCGQLYDKIDNWVCSYNCLLKFMFHNKERYKISKTAIPILHHIETEKEIFNRRVCENLIDEVYFLKELAQIVIEFLN